MGYVDAEMDGKHIYAVLQPYNASWKDIIKYEITGSAWDPHSKRWKLPLDLATCRSLRDHFGKALRVRVGLADWAAKEIAYRKELDKLATANTAAVRALAEESPVLHTAMQARPYQLVGSAWMARVRNALLGDDPGLGKTLQVMGAVVEAELFGPILVFAPKTAALTTWPDELGKWLPDDEVTVVSHLTGQQRRVALDAYLERAREAYAEGRRAWLICNTEMARIKVHLDPEDKKKTLKDERGEIVTTVDYPQLFVPKWQAVIVDESQKSLITHTPQWWKQSQARAGMTKLPVARGGLKLALSGTPMRGKLSNLWGTLNWLDPDKYKSHWAWCAKWFNGRSGYFGGLEMDDDPDSMDPETLAALYESIRPIFLRRTKSEVAKDLPPKMYAGYRLEEQNPDSPPGIWLPLEGKQKKLYDQIKKDAAAQLTNGTIMVDGLLHQMSLFKRIACSAGRLEKSVDKDGKEHQHYRPELPSNKFDWLVEWLTERGMFEPGEGDKVVIASQFTDLVDLFAAELAKMGLDSFVLTGKTSAAKRKEMVARWQQPGGPRVFFLNTKAGGVSLTLDAADDLVILDETWDPDDQTQVEDRIHRVSRIHNVTIWYVRTLGTIEEEIATTAGSRDQIQRKLMDGQRGVEFAKKLLGES